MKILLYLEAEQFLSHSGIGRAMKHQQRALDLMGIDWTKNPEDDYDILHLNTYGFSSWKMLKKAKKAGKKGNLPWSIYQRRFSKFLSWLQYCCSFL